MAAVARERQSGALLQRRNAGQQPRAGDCTAPTQRLRTAHAPEWSDCSLCPWLPGTGPVPAAGEQLVCVQAVWVAATETRTPKRASRPVFSTLSMLEMCTSSLPRRAAMGVAGWAAGAVRQGTRRSRHRLRRQRQCSCTPPLRRCAWALRLRAMQGGTAVPNNHTMCLLQWVHVMALAVFCAGPHEANLEDGASDLRVLAPPKLEQSVLAMCSRTTWGGAMAVAAVCISPPHSPAKGSSSKPAGAGADAGAGVGAAPKEANGSDVSS